MGLNVRVLHGQYSAYALHKSTLTPRKSVVGTIVKGGGVRWVSCDLLVGSHTDLYSLSLHSAYAEY